MSAQPTYGTSDHYLGEKGEEYFAWQSAGGDFAARIIAHRFEAHIAPASTVLDFGCGGGFLLKQLRCARRLGVEINPAARRHAVSLGVECYEQVEEVPDGVADVVISNHALEHVPYPIGVLKELRKKVKPDGLLVLCVPIDNWKHGRVYDPNDQNHHLYTWTGQLFGNCLVEAGCRVVQITSRIHAWPGGWTVAAYGRLPLRLFHAVCYVYGLLSGKGTELIAVAWVRPD